MLCRLTISLNLLLQLKGMKTLTEQVHTLLRERKTHQPHSPTTGMVKLLLLTSQCRPAQLLSQQTRLDNMPSLSLKTHSSCKDKTALTVPLQVVPIRAVAAAAAAAVAAAAAAAAAAQGPVKTLA